MELESLKPDDIMTGWKSFMKRQPGLKKAYLLLNVARKSVGTRQAIEAYKFHLEQLLEEYDLVVQQLNRVELTIQKELIKIPFADKLLKIKGISDISLGRYFRRSRRFKWVFAR